MPVNERTNRVLCPVCGVWVQSPWLTAPKRAQSGCAREGDSGPRGVCAETYIGLLEGALDRALRPGAYDADARPIQPFDLMEKLEGISAAIRVVARQHGPTAPDAPTVRDAGEAL